MRNFFFFLDGDLLGDSSPSCSPASAGSSTSPASASASAASAAAGAEAGAKAESSAGSAGASEGSSGVKSGRVCLRVAASLSSLKVCSGRDSDGRERRRESAIPEGHFCVCALRSVLNYQLPGHYRYYCYKKSPLIHRLPLKTHQAPLTYFVFRDLKNTCEAKHKSFSFYLH